MKKPNNNIPITFKSSNSLKTSLGKTDHLKAFVTKEVLHDESTIPVEEYGGDYIVDPSTEVQTLKTANLKMKENVTVNAVATYEVSNEAGGFTFSILS